jgi:hypothetical protein
MSDEIKQFNDDFKSSLSLSEIIANSNDLSKDEIILYLKKISKKLSQELSQDDISNYPHGHIIHDSYGGKYWIILHHENLKKEKRFLFLDSPEADERKLPHNSRIDAITNFPIGHYFDDFGGYFADIPIDSKALGITPEYITNNIRCYTDVNKYGEYKIYYLIINYNNQNYCFYLEDDKDVLIDYLLNVQYFHYIEYDKNHKSFYEHLKENHNIYDIYTRCMSLLTY